MSAKKHDLTTECPDCEGWGFVRKDPNVKMACKCTKGRVPAVCSEHGCPNLAVIVDEWDGPLCERHS